MSSTDKRHIPARQALKSLDATTHLRVLVIDDDEEDSALTQRALAEIPWFTCTVDCASNYGDALEAIRGREYDVILLDHGLGAQSGLELLEEAYGATLPVAVVLLTGMASHQVDEAASRAGIAHLLEKSELRSGPLERSVRYALERTRIERELRNARAFFRAAFDALTDHVALLDTHGRIMEVNRAWQTFAAENGYSHPGAGCGESYLQVCQSALAGGDGIAGEVGQGLSALLAGSRETFSIMYPCHSPQEQRWFKLCAAHVKVDGARRIMVSHENVTERLREERELRESAARYRLIYESHPSPLWLMDDDTAHFLSVNDVALALYGYTRDEFLALTPWDLRVADEHEELVRLRVPGRVGLQRIGHARHRKKDGEVFDVELTLRSMELDGHPCQMVLATDVTDRRNAERAQASALAAAHKLADTLEFERFRLRMIFAQAPAFMAVMRGPPHVLELVNEACVELLGGNTLGLPLVEAVPELVEQGFVALVDQVFADRRPFVASQLPLFVRRPDGTTRHFVLNFVLQPLEEADGNVTGVLMHGVDVTENALSAEALRQSEEQYRSLVELSPDGIIVHVNGTVVFANSAAARILRADSVAKLLGKSLIDFVHPDDHDAADARMAMLAAGETLKPSEAKWLAIDGRVRDVEVSSVSFAFGGEPAIHTVFRDTTAHRHLENQLRQAQKMEAVGQLAGGVAHDFNNLLTVIKSNVELLLEDLDSSDPHREDLAEVGAAADRATDLTRQLLAFSRKQVLQTRVLDCNTVVAGVKPMLSRLIREDVTVEIRLKEQLGWILADAGQLEQVVLNLAVNARDAMPHGGHLLIETDETTLTANSVVEDGSVVIPGRYVSIGVSDSGMGIAPEARAHIFEPFFTTKPVGAGTGLGLATVYGIVKQFGGYLDVKSEVGRGTTFCVLLPVATGALTIPEATAVARDTSGTETVLLVEDMEALREIARRVLVRSGYTVLEAHNGREALEIAGKRAAPIHLLLTDVVMPEMNGLRLAQQLQRMRPDIAVLFMSGYADDDETRKGVEEARAGFIHKPFSPVQLLIAVRDALEI